MMGCHFQDLPCKASLCLRDLYLGKKVGPFFVCDEPTAIACPHRGWEHMTHLDVCRTRVGFIERCRGCGGRHRGLIEALRCELACSVRRSFDEEDEGDLEDVCERLPPTMRASAWRMIRSGVIERDGGRCRLCGKDLSTVPSWLTEVHHVRPKAEGGSDHPSNLITLCVMCHKRITVEALLSGVIPPSMAEDCLPRDCLENFR
jgi:5-methylcytosine-specific restriction endonuclease McrA